MLKKDYLTELATKNQTSLDNIFREYIQNVFLRFLYQKKASKEILFKGGTALKLVYNSPRFSKDLDFTLLNITFNKIETTVLEVLSNLEKESFQPKIIESKKTTGGYLAELAVEIYHEKVRISVQGSKRKKNDARKDVKLIVNNFIPDYSAYLLEEKLLIGEKIQAALTRSKPRDFFDIYFLLRGGHIPIELRKKLSKVADIIKEKDINYKEDLSYLLPYSLQNIASEFPSPLLNELKKYA